ncbi:MAG: hypothetical protein AMXMBFR7_31640 [Planctomycetota bacterium]
MRTQSKWRWALVFALCGGLSFTQSTRAQGEGGDTVSAAVRELLQTARQRMQAGNLAEARLLYEKALQLEPGNPEAQRVLANLKAARDHAPPTAEEGRLALLAEALGQPLDLGELTDTVPGEEARKKYRMAQLAIQDRDAVLADRFMAEAFAIAPAYGALRFEYAHHLAEQGFGRRAQALLKEIAAPVELQARAEYLAAKIQVAETLNGTYAELSKKVLPVGKPAEAARAAGTLAIEAGEVTWLQQVNGRAVKQSFTFPVHALKAGEESYVLALTWRAIESDLKEYGADKREPMLVAKRTPTGWWLQLKVSDTQGNGGEVVFEPQAEPVKQP